MVWFGGRKLKVSGISVTLNLSSAGSMSVWHLEREVVGSIEYTSRNWSIRIPTTTMRLSVQISVRH